MSTEFANRSIVRDGLIFSLDAFNRKSYPGSGTEIYDLHRNKNNGTFQNGVTSDAFSLILDGTNQWIDFNDEDLAKFDYNNPFSVDFWVKKQTGSVFDWVVGRQGIAGPYQGWSVLYRSSPLGALNFGINQVSGSQTRSIRTVNQYNDDVWRHHCCVYDGSGQIEGLKIYTNAVEDDVVTLADAGTLTDTVAAGAGARMVIGRRYDENANYPEMQLRTLNIYNKALSELEIKQNYFALKEKIYGT